MKEWQKNYREEKKPDEQRGTDAPIFDEKLTGTLYELHAKIHPSEAPALDQHLVYGKLTKDAEGMLVPEKSDDPNLRFKGISLAVDTTSQKFGIVGFKEGSAELLDSDYRPIVTAVSGQFVGFEEGYVYIREDAKDVFKVSPDGKKTIVPNKFNRTTDRYDISQPLQVGSWSGEQIKNALTDRPQVTENIALAYGAGFKAKAENPERDPVPKSLDTTELSVTIPLDKSLVYGQLKRTTSRFLEPVDETLDARFLDVQLAFDIETNKVGLLGVDNVSVKLLDTDYRPVAEALNHKFVGFADDHVLVRDNDNGLVSKITPHGIEPFETALPYDSMVETVSITYGMEEGPLSGEGIKELGSRWASVDAPYTLAYSAGFVAKAEKDTVSKDLAKTNLDGPKIEPVVEVSEKESQADSVEVTREDKMRAVIGVLKGVQEIAPRTAYVTDQLQVIDSLSQVAAHIIESPKHDGEIHDHLPTLIKASSGKVSPTDFAIARSTIESYLTKANPDAKDVLADYLERNKELFVGEPESVDEEPAPPGIIQYTKEKAHVLYNRVTLAHDDLQPGTKLAGFSSLGGTLITAVTAVTHDGNPLVTGGISGVLAISATAYEMHKRKQDDTKDL